MLKILHGNFHSIDCVKLVMAVFVVAIHTSAYNCYPQAWVNMIGTALISLAVPFFFVASGFLLWHKLVEATIEQKLDRIQKWLKKTIRLYLVWTFIFLPYAIYGFARENLSITKSIIFYIRNILLVGENYWSWPLWYLLAMIVAGGILYVVVRIRCKQKHIYILAIVLAITGIILNTLHEQCDGYHQLYFSIFKTTRNGFFIGFPYICIGIAIAQHGILRSTRILWLIFLISIGLNIVDIPFALFIAVYALFSLTLHMQLPSSKKEQYQQARLSSTVIYFVHMIWIGLITLLYPANIAPYWLFLWIMSLSSITALVVVKNKNNKLIKWCFQ